MYDLRKVSNVDEFIIFQPWMKIKKGLNGSKYFRTDPFKLIDEIKEEFNLHLIREITDSILNFKFTSSENEDYIDYRNNQYRDSVKLHYEFCENVNFAFVSGLVATEFYTKITFFKFPSPNVCYAFGKIQNVEFFINTLLPYNDNRIFLFDVVNINLDKIELEDFEINGIKTKQLRFDYGFEIENPKLVYLIQNERSFGYNNFLSKLRNQKIDKIINFKF